MRCGCRYCSFCKQVCDSSGTYHSRMQREQIIRNFVFQSFLTLREKDRYIEEGNSKSNYELFWEQLNNGFSMGFKSFKPSNTNVESFYRGTLSKSEFCSHVEENILKKASDKFDCNFDPLLTISWDSYSTVLIRKPICERLPRLCGRQLWAIFNKLDMEGTEFLHIDDIVELIIKIYSANGKEETEENIREWFCDQQSIDFWSFFSALVENHLDLLEAHVIQQLHEEVFHEIFKEGKMTKKGHKVQSWKERWFVLNSTQLAYYESQENRTLKGTIMINKSSKVEKIPPMRDYKFLFRITDGKTSRPYDICARDPQMLQDWVDMLQVLILSQTEDGKNMLQKVRSARRKLFPQMGACLPTYQPTPTEYNEGIYRVVSPAMKVNKTSSPSTIPTSVSPPSSGTLGSRPLSPDSPPKELIFEIKSQVTPSIYPLLPPQLDDIVNSPSISPTNESRDQSPNRKKGPPVSPYRRHSTDMTNSTHGYVNVSYTNQTGENIYSLANKDGPVNDTRRRSLSPSMSSPLLGDPDGYVNVKRIGNEYIPIDQGEREENNISPTSVPHSQTPPLMEPVPLPRVKKPLQVTMSLETSSPVPVPRSQPISHMVSEPTESSTPYTLLSFDNTPEQSTRPINNKPVITPRTQVPKTKFGYSDVILTEDDTTVKDVDKALQLKGNRPPPTPPSRYNPQSNLSPTTEVGPPPPARNISYKKTQSQVPIPTPRSQPVSLDNNYPNLPPKIPSNSSSHHVVSQTPQMNGLDDSLPPPPPRRMESNRGTSMPIHTDRSSPNPLPPLPPR